MGENPRRGLIKQFVFAAERAGATVACVRRSPKEICAALTAAIGDVAPVVFAKPGDLKEELFDEFIKSVHPIIEPNDHQLEASGVGITDAFAGVARTGSVCVSITPNLSGTVSLFCRKHIAVVDSVTIVARPRDVFSTVGLRQKALSRDFIFISGPSATADMGPLVRGVHGPGKLHVIILE